jgi:hypothetical protein
MPLSFTRTLRLKVRTEAYAWLNAAAVEVNEVFNYCNETSLKAATRTDNKRKWLSGFDLCSLWLIPPSSAYRVREAGLETARAAA